jgi:uncharacterized protein (DUF1800 family)
MNPERLRLGLLGLLVLLLGACSDSAVQSEPTPTASTGQVAQITPSSVNYYAAARFAEQATFGANPAVIAEIRTKGFAKWIDDQFALPASELDLAPVLSFADPAPDEHHRHYRSAFPNLAIGAPDQLRTRVAWALSQFVVVSDRGIDFVGAMYWINMLQKGALGNYSDLLTQTSISPAMGQFLNNGQNRPKSAECPHCAPNENYARELMQLFSLGVVKLNPDGTPVKDAKGQLQETYTQRDVEELARVLTGWTFNNEPRDRPNRNWANWGKPMVPSTWAAERDSGAKTVLGRTFPAGQSQAKDLADTIDLLMAHGNTAPFVATRLIQHLVKSNPSPAYVGRVAAKFRDNGQGVRGDLKAVVKTILLDEEARAGDLPSRVIRDDGKLREPFLFHTALWRGLGCSKVPTRGNWVPMPPNQAPFNAESVFSFYAPTDRAPGSNLLAPEQRLLNASELTNRLNLSSGLRWDHEAQQSNLTPFTQAGCSVQALVDAYAASPRVFADLLNDRYFRGAMPPTLRTSLEQLIAKPQWDARNPQEGAFRMLDYALSSPYFGVVK